jgi:hypothetical protein
VKPVQFLLAILAVAVLSGCAARVFRVPLSVPDATEVTSSLLVLDGRMDEQIYMTGISFNSASHIYLLEAEPPLEVALRSYIYDAQSKMRHRPSVKKAEVTVEELDLKNKVGFAKADELYCKIESKVVTFSETKKYLQRRVKTFSRNDKNISPMVQTSAKVILEQCLEQHAAEVAESMVR